MRLDPWTRGCQPYVCPACRQLRPVNQPIQTTTTPGMVTRCDEQLMKSRAW